MFTILRIVGCPSWVTGAIRLSRCPSLMIGFRMAGQASAATADIRSSRENTVSPLFNDQEPLCMSSTPRRFASFGVGGMSPPGETVLVAAGAVAGLADYGNASG